MAVFVDSRLTDLYLLPSPSDARYPFVRMTLAGSDGWPVVDVGRDRDRDGWLVRVRHDVGIGAATHFCVRGTAPIPSDAEMPS
jgi:hypothetical protein